jgi:WD40 repeat protein
MGAADSSESKGPASDPRDAAPEGNGLPRSGSAGSADLEPDEATKKGEDHATPEITGVASAWATLDPSDSAGFILQLDPKGEAESHSLRGDHAGAEAERSAVVPPSGDPSSGPTIAGVGGRAPAALRERPLPAIRGYEILGELGRGGMGVVYRARQVRLNRPCALKMILAGAHADTAAAVRFLAEAEAVAKLQHPNIVQIHHIGEADGLPFFELEYLDGGSLDKRLDGTPWHERRAAAMSESLARGVVEAHRLGVIHRDLKPGNVLLAADGTPKITDFGLAKSLASESGLTATDSIMGSPGYMAPEQAEGKTKQVGAPADIYALGAILYELLTGRPPFRGATVLETLEQVKATEPVPPSRLVPGLPRDVETIALKCLQKEPAKRYDSAAALAEDLRRFLNGEPIVARPVPPWVRAVKWARRRPAIATLVVAVLVLLASLLGLGVWSYAEIDRSLTIAKAQSKRAQAQTQVATERAEDLAQEDYINRVNRAYRELQDDNVALAEDLLQGCPIERRGWEWHYVNRLCRPERLSVEVPAGSISAIAYSPDGRLIATGSGGHFSKGKGGSNVELWDREAGWRRPTLHRTANVIWGLAFSPDGRKLAVGGTDPQIEVVDAKTGEVVWAKQEPKLPQAMALAFSADGQSLAVGFGLYSQDKAFQVKLYEVATGRESGTFEGPKGGVNDLAFHPDGRRLAVAGSGLVEVWDVVARAKVHELRGHTKWVYCLAYSSDGKWLATGGWDRTVKLWDATTGAERFTTFGHHGFVLDLAFSPDGRALATTSEDRSARLWEVPSGRPIGVFHGHTDFVQALAFAPDGRELASGGLEGTVKVWDLRTSLPVVFDGHTGWVGRLWCRRDGRRVVSVSTVGQVPETTKGWDPSTGEPDPTLTGIDPDKHGDEYLQGHSYKYGEPPHSVTSPDGKLRARVLRRSAGYGTRSKEYANSTAEVVEIETGRSLHRLIGHTAEVTQIAFSPDGRRIATTSFDGTIKLWDTATGREVFTLRGHTAGVVALAFSPGGRQIVSGGIDYTARVWDATPLPEEILLSQDARHQEKTRALKELGRGSPDALEAESHARVGRWFLATAALGRAVELEPNSLELQHQHILSLVAAEDRGKVRRTCEALLKRFPKATDPQTPVMVISSCVISPDAVSDHTALLALAESARDWVDDSVSHVHGAALYRAGRFEDAIRSLAKFTQMGGGDNSPQVCAFLAMAHQRLGHRDEARRWLEKLAAYQPKKGADFSWDDVEVQILRREAESLILGSVRSAPPSAPTPPAREATGDPEARSW